jgi:hypothetical protein
MQSGYREVNALTLPMLPCADANLANQVGAVPDVDG